MLLIAMLEVSLAMLLPAIIVLILYLTFRKSVQSSSEEKRSIFIGGEKLEPEGGFLPPGGFYWALWNKTFSSTYRILREKIHTGVLNDWLFYMIIWFVILLILLFRSVAV
ncbi:MAG: hypothetical protein RMJ31_01840 [Nitrososphaerota archaeon]|nr:hypothetical protein [Nitrososphaerota archaeon]